MTLEKPKSVDTPPMSFSQLYGEVRDLNMQNIRNFNMHYEEGREMNNEKLFQICSTLNNEYNLGLDNTSLEVQTNGSNIEINYFDDKIGNDKKITISISEDKAVKIITNSEGNVLSTEVLAKNPDLIQVNKYYDTIYNKLDINAIGFNKDGTDFYISTFSTNGGGKGMMIEKHLPPDLQSKYILLRDKYGNYEKIVSNMGEEKEHRYGLKPNLVKDMLENDFKKRMDEGAEMEENKIKQDMEINRELYAQNDQVTEDDHKEAEEKLNSQMNALG